MSWIEKLYQTYENNTDKIGNPNDKIPLFPICHTMQNAHIEIVIDGEGIFKRASTISKDDSPTIIPCTESSAGRAGKKPINHPLCDKLQYVAGDFNKFGGEVTVGFQNDPVEPYNTYKADLQNWCLSENSHPKAEAILKYIKKNQVVKDLVDKKIIHLESTTSDTQKLMYEWLDTESKKPEIFKLLNGKLKNSGKRNPWQAEAFIRWAVEIPGYLNSSIMDSSLQKAWITYLLSMIEHKGLCFVTGEQQNLADSHPVKLRNAGDKAKLISSNDTSGFTFKGRFIENSQVAGLSYEITQKGHSAFRWLLARQGKVFYVKSKGQAKPRLAVVAWAVSGMGIPDPLADSDDLLNDGSMEHEEKATERVRVGFTAQGFGVRLSQYISGYSTKLDNSDQIIVMGVDSATPGRMAITYYRELTGSDFLTRIEAWHKGCAWLQRFSKDKEFYGAPSPKDIAQAAYGTKDDDLIKVDDNLQKTTVERLIPCIIDGAPLPWDIVESCVRKAAQRQSLPDWAWQKTLGIACGLYRYYFKEKEDFTMGLDRERKTRDYLYGRLLAVADCIESWALSRANEKRQTNAARLMQRFADHPYDTWRTLALNLTHHKARMGALIKKHLATEEEIMNAFEIDDFKTNKPLSGEFLLGFHCQRSELHKSKKSNNEENNDELN